MKRSLGDSKKKKLHAKILATKELFIAIRGHIRQRRSFAFAEEAGYGPVTLFFSSLSSDLLFSFPIPMTRCFLHHCLYVWSNEEIQSWPFTRSVLWIVFSIGPEFLEFKFSNEFLRLSRIFQTMTNLSLYGQPKRGNDQTRGSKPRWREQALC